MHEITVRHWVEMAPNDEDKGCIKYKFEPFRQEMVGQLLKDIVEAAERPNLSSASASYDQ